MAGTFTDFLEKKLQDHVLSATTYTPPATVWVGLLTDTNTAAQRDAGTITEVSTSGTAYARVSMTNNATNWPAASGITAAKSNGTAITFPAPVGSNWGTVTAWGIFDASTAGNLLIWGDLAASRVINAGDGAPSFAIGALSGTLD